MIQILLMLSISVPANALIGYDCGSRALNVTTLSLLDVGACDIPHNPINASRVYAQLLQINDYKETDVIHCKVEIHRTVYYCGAYSHVSVVKHGHAEFITEISHGRCQEAYHFGVLRYGDRHVFSDLKINQTTSHPVVFAGSILIDGTCKGTSYGDAYGSWDSVVVQGFIRITIKSQKARVALDDNKIYLSSGTACTMNVEMCIDSENGYTFWKPIPSNNCNFEQYGILYEGYTTKMVDTSGTGDHTVYSLATDDITFALASKGKESICGYTLIKTEHPKLLIFETVKGESFASRDTLSINNLDIFTYMNSKFVYVEKHLRTQIQRLYQDTILQRCNLERQTLKNALTIATQAPDQFAYNLMKGPGYMAVTAGEVVHVVRCIPVEIQISHSDQCYAELRVTHKNNTYYLTPRTHVLKGRGTEIDCNRLMPSYYYIDDVWYRMLPKPVEGNDPATIKPMTHPTWNYINPASLATSGIYTDQELNDLREHIMFPVEKSSLLNNVAREIDGYPVRQGANTLSKLLHADAIDGLVNSTWDKFWKKFLTFGSASAGVLAIMFTLHVIKGLLNVFINGYFIYQVYGWSLRLLGAVWSTMTRLILHTRPNRNRSPYEVEEQRELELLPQNESSPNPAPAPRTVPILNLG